MTDFIESVQETFKTIPLVREAFFNFDSEMNVCGVCLFGAALYACGIRDVQDIFAKNDPQETRLNDRIIAFMRLKYGARFNRDATHPIDGVQMPIDQIIYNLIDSREWTEQEVINWLVTVRSIWQS